jgi:hypothetical protein
MRKSSVSYAPRGVVKKPIALRLLAPEMARHEILVANSGASSNSIARQMYLRGWESYEREQAAKAASATASIRRGA